MEKVPVLIDYDVCQKLMEGLNPDATNEIIKLIKNGTLFFTTVQGKQLPMSVNADGKLIVNERLIFQIISLSHSNMNLEKVQLYKEEITKLLLKYINALNACGATVQITISKDWASYSYLILDCEPELFSEIIQQVNDDKFICPGNLLDNI